MQGATHAVAVEDLPRAGVRLERLKDGHVLGERRHDDLDGTNAAFASRGL